MQADFDIEHCRWCNGDGKDHGTLGMLVVRDCPRCEGSGRIYVTSRESATGRRRVYKGAAPADQLRAGMVAAHHQQELTEALQKPRRASRRKDARSHAA